MRETMESSRAQTLWRKMWRKKIYTPEGLEATELKRCLSMWELTLYGVGQTIGSGIYVLSGTVVRYHAGPAAPVSYIIGGVISLISALCYAEFSTILPRAGSSYSYTYYTIGEWVAYVIGWDLMLEHALVAAGTCRALVSSADLLLHHSIRNWTVATIGTVDVVGLSRYPELLAGVVVLIVAAIVILGAKQSVVTTAVLAAMNLIISLIIIGAGLSHADISNWTNANHGGFMPFGLGGVMSATSIIFTAYAGYDAVCTAAEETKNPTRTLPVAIVSTMIISMVIYVTLVSTLTLAVPYYAVDPDAAFTKLFQDIGQLWVADFVTVTIMLAAFSVSLCNMFAVSRIAFAMARDAVLFKCFGYVNKRTGTPVLAVLAFALVTALLSMLFSVEHLAEVVSVGTLIAATIVPLSVLVLRYRSPADDIGGKVYGARLKMSLRSNSFLAKVRPQITVNVIIFLITFCSIVTSIMVRCVTRYDVGPIGNVVCYAVAGVMGVLVVFGAAGLCVFEQNRVMCSFRIPWVPFLPTLSVLLNVVCLGQISDMGWGRYVIWMAVGTLIYFGYGIWNSTPTHVEDERTPLATIVDKNNYLTGEKKEIDSSSY